MSQGDDYTKSKGFAYVLLLLAIASTVGQLGHLTTGHFFLYLTVPCLVGSVCLFLRNKIKAKRIETQKQPRLSAQNAAPILPESQQLAAVENQLSEAFSLTEYNQDMFYDIVWRWRYNIAFSDTPREIKPFCPECDRPLVITDMPKPTESFGRRPLGKLATLRCRYHPKPRLIHVDMDEEYVEVKERIEENIKSGRWKEIVARQKANRGF